MPASVVPASVIVRTGNGLYPFAHIGLSPLHTPLPYGDRKHSNCKTLPRAMDGISPAGFLASS
jgi:hypothetical protein